MDRYLVYLVKFPDLNASIVDSTQFSLVNPVQFFSTVQLYCSRLSVGLLLCYSRLTLLWRSQKKLYGMQPWKETVWDERERERERESWGNGSSSRKERKRRERSSKGNLLSIPVQILFSNSVIMKSICYRTRVNQLVNENNTTGWVKKVCTGRSSWTYVRTDLADRQTHLRKLLLPFLPPASLLTFAFLLNSYPDLTRPAPWTLLG